MSRLLGLIVGGVVAVVTTALLAYSWLMLWALYTVLVKFLEILSYA